MSHKKYTVDLTEDQRDELENFISSGVHRIQEATRARILLKVDDGWTDKDTSEALDCGNATVKRMRERFTEDGIAAIRRARVACPRAGEEPTTRTSSPYSFWLIAEPTTAT
jgi:hypothetical protein